MVLINIYIVLFNILDVNCTNTITNEQYDIFNRNTPLINLPTYHDVLERYEYENANVFTREGFYRLSQDFPELIKPFMIYHSILFEYLFCISNIF